MPNKTRLTATILGSLLCTSAHASTVFMPTDNTINFLEFYGGSSASIGLFDDDDPTFSGDYLAIRAAGDQVTFTTSGSNHVLSGTFAGTPLILTDSNYFSLAAWSPGTNTWLSPDAVTCSSASGSCFLSWAGLLVEFVVDLAIAEPVIPPIPLPSSVLLLGTGAFGLVAVARRSTFKGHTVLARSKDPAPIQLLGRA